MPCAAAIAAVLTGACANPDTALLAASSSVTPTGPYGTAAPATPDAPFNPFADHSSASGARQVIAAPTLAEVLEPGPLPEMSWGRADAPVTIVKYASLTCPHCRTFHETVFPELKRAYIDTGKVRFIIREFPIGRSSGTATIALRCAPPQKYLDLYGKFLNQQAQWVAEEVRHDAIFKVASQVGMKRAEFDACLANRTMIAGLEAIKDRGRTLGIIGTPNFFVNERRVKSVLGMAEIRQMVDPLLVTAAVPASGER